jgi:hypothetical protein
LATPNKMTNRQRRRLSIQILDEDGQPLPKLLDGEILTFTPTDLNVLGITDVDPPYDFERYVTSGKDGSASVVVHADGMTDPSGKAVVLPDLTFDFEVDSSTPTSLDGTIGDPEDESPPAAPPDAPPATS